MAVVSLRRGFKSWCENAARGYRRDLGLHEYGAIDPKQLANHLGVSVWKPEEIPGIAPSVLEHLLEKDSSSWSAVTLALGQRFVIIINTSHSLARQNNDLAHELAHIILKHGPTQMFFTSDGKMMLAHYKRDYEEEADHLAAAILAPREAILHLVQLNQTDEQMAAYFGISKQLLVMRKNKTGISKQVSYRQA